MKPQVGDMCYLEETVSAVKSAEWRASGNLRSLSMEDPEVRALLDDIHNSMPYPPGWDTHDGTDDQFVSFCLMEIIEVSEELRMVRTRLLSCPTLEPRWFTFESLTYQS